MKVYDYMNSEAIARHCQELNYSFTPLQTAWLINRSRRHTLKEKHRAYGWVMEHIRQIRENMGITWEGLCLAGIAKQEESPC